ncbi:flavin-dependent dehydrogenase [Archangium gephyra]|uniref:Dehydrogenase flavoprotein LodB n=1 Tax=Archangium gephyra TaxID=48 RepID=A0AAC8Q245_9BACT|nr:FAD-dependent oxidoreductase [Archangium gephyra]AKI99599.1 Dehydrogenase flavoprotein LodB [Archangium gephyra]REG27868.1 flavin-dependent dehydrogenase [Archangium gephyra]
MSPARQYAVLVAGGGVAGISTALALAREGMSVCVLERTRYEQWRPGETLSPLAHAELSRLGVSLSERGEDFIPSHGIEAAWGSEQPRFHSFITNPYGEGWHVDRQRLDALLARQAEAHGVPLLRLTSAMKLEREQGRWRVHAQTASGEVELTCEAVVDATGRASSVARQCGARRYRVDALCSVSAVLEQPEGMAQTLLVESTPLGWWYAAPLPGRRVIVSLLSDTDLLTRAGALRPAGWCALLSATRHLQARVGTPPESLLFHIRPCETSSLERSGGERWVAVGDAASGLDPLSSGGILKALRSGRQAAEALRSALGGDDTAIPRYAEAQSSGFTQYLTARLGHYATEQRWPDAPFWQRRMEASAASAKLQTERAIP